MRFRLRRGVCQAHPGTRPYALCVSGVHQPPPSRTCIRASDIVPPSCERRARGRVVLVIDSGSDYLWLHALLDRRAAAAAAVLAWSGKFLREVSAALARPDRAGAVPSRAESSAQERRFRRLLYRGRSRTGGREPIIKGNEREKRKVFCERKERRYTRRPTRTIYRNNLCDIIVMRFN